MASETTDQKTELPRSTTIHTKYKVSSAAAPEMARLVEAGIVPFDGFKKKIRAFGMSRYQGKYVFAPGGRQISPLFRW